jgi:hypothetical protein
MISALKTLNNTPRPLIDGRPFEGVMAYTYREHLAEFVAAGVEVFRLSLPLGWVGPGRYDYRETDEIVAAFCAASPRAKLFPLLWLDGAELKWWELAHPGERALARSRTSGDIIGQHPDIPRYATADDQPDPNLDNFDRHHQQSPCLHSFASRVWKSEAIDALTRLLRHLDEAFPDRFVGYYLCAGLSYEWFNWGNYTDDVLFDYSEPMSDYFREWLRRHYLTPAALAAAWRQPVRDFDSITPPLPENRPGREAAPLLDPRHHGPAADFAAALSDAQADAFLDLCRAARKATPERRLVGGFYGYWWTQTNFPGPVRNGHLALQRVLNSEDVDFLASPYDYTNRGVGGVNSSQTLPGSMTRHGKLYINSTDIKLADDSYGWQSFIRVPRTASEAVELMKRDFATSLAAGQDQSWVDLFGGAFKHPALRDTLARLQAITHENMALRQAGRAECLVVVDEESLRWTTPNTPMTVPLFGVQKQWHLLRTGMPWTQITLTDFLDYDWPEARVVYFVNLFRVDTALRQRLHQKLCATGCAAIWTLWPGLLGDDGPTLTGVKELTGFEVEWLSLASGDWTFRTRDGDTAWPAHLEYGTGVLREDYAARMKYYPLPESFAAAPRLGLSPEAGDEVVADWIDVSIPALALTRRLGFTSIFNTGPLLPESILHAFVRGAGAHAYTPPGDLVYANDRFLGIYTGLAERRCVQFREPVRVFDLFAGQWLTAGPVTSLELNTPPETMALWRLDG